MFELSVELVGDADDVTITAFGSPLAAVREVHSMARTYAAMQDDDGQTLKACDLLFGKGVEQQVRREKFYATGLRGKKPSKSWPVGMDPQPVTGRVGTFVFAITPDAPALIAEACDALVEQSMATVSA